MDVLTDLLQRSRARGAAFSQTTAHGEWGVAFDAVPQLAVHVVAEGEPYLWTNDPEAALRLAPGDLVLVSGHIEHQMAYRPGAPCEPLLCDADDVRNRIVAGPGERTRFFCGAYLFEGDLCDGLIDALPEVVRLQPAAGSPLRPVADLLAAEMVRDEPGQQALLDRLLDVALVQLLREYFANHRENAPAWFRAMDDPPVAAALRAVHARPAHPWTVAELAAEAALSRAAFAKRFTAAMGVGPLSYLTDWRMALARERLRDGRDGLAAIAEAVGYASEFSFAAAFKRRYGVAPGRWRSRAAA